MTLFRQHAKTEALSVLVWSVILGLAGFMTTYMWEMFSSSGSLADLQKTLETAPGALKGLFGSGVDLLTFNGWVQGYALGTWVALPYVIFTALFVAGMVTREMDRRTMEFLLSLPVSRAQFIVSRWLVLVMALAALHLTQFVGVWSSAVAIGQQAEPGRYALAQLSSTLLFLFVGSLMLAASVLIDDYGRGTGAMLGIGLGLNLFHMATGDATGALKSLRDVLPFSLHDVAAIVMKGEVPWGDMAILGGGSLLFLAVAIWLFQRKQITV